MVDKLYMVKPYATLAFADVIVHVQDAEHIGVIRRNLSQELARITEMYEPKQSEVDGIRRAYIEFAHPVNSQRIIGRLRNPTVGDYIRISHTATMFNDTFNKKTGKFIRERWNYEHYPWEGHVQHTSCGRAELKR